MALQKYFSPLLFIALIAFSLPALANTGKIVYLTGDVKVNGQTMQKSYRVKSGDKITTGSNGKVNIVMADKSVMDIEPNTQFQLERFTFNKKKPAESKSIMNLLRGGFRYISGLVGRTNYENAQIKMGTATAGIRGSVGSFKFNGKEVEIVTIQGVTTMTMTKPDGTTSSFTFQAGTTGSGNTGTGTASSTAVTGDNARLVTALNGLKDGVVPTNLTGDEMIFMMGAVLAEGDTLGISAETMTGLVTQMINQAPPDVQTAVAAAATIVSTGTAFEAATNTGVNNSDAADSVESGALQQEIIEQQEVDTSTEYNEGDEVETPPS